MIYRPEDILNMNERDCNQRNEKIKNETFDYLYSHMYPIRESMHELCDYVEIKENPNEYASINENFKNAVSITLETTRDMYEYDVHEVGTGTFSTTTVGQSTTREDDSILGHYIYGDRLKTSTVQQSQTVENTVKYPSAVKISQKLYIRFKFLAFNKGSFNEDNESIESKLSFYEENHLKYEERKTISESFGNIS